jgi:hypothetical protein
MILILAGLVTSALFAGAAFHIGWAGQPARLTLDHGPLLKVWKRSYSKGFQMQAILALIAPSPQTR